MFLASVLLDVVYGYEQRFFDPYTTKGGGLPSRASLRDGHLIGSADDSRPRSNRLAELSGVIDYGCAPGIKKHHKGFT